MAVSMALSSLIFSALQIFVNGADNAGTAITRPLALGFYTTPETQHPIGLDIVGKIPTWVSGSLYRGASGSWDSGNYTSEHWFDGFSRNHRFEISNGKVEYRSRNASDEILDFVRETGLYPGGTFGGDPCKVILGGFEVTFRDGTNAVGNTSSQNVGVAYIANFPGLKQNMSTSNGPFVTLVMDTDANALQQLDPVTLEPIELFTYQASNPLLLDSGRSGAHPAHALNGDICNYVLDLDTTPPEYRVFCIDQTGFGKVLATITDAPPAYIHSLFITENHLILIVWQCDIDTTAKQTYNTMGMLKPWDAEREALFYVIDTISGTVVAKYTTKTFFAFHQINSFEDPETGSIVIDLPAFSNHHFLEEAYIPNLRAKVGIADNASKIDLAATFHRYRLPDYAHAPRHSNGTLIPRPAVLDFAMNFTTANLELPRINQAYSQKPYQFVYGVHTEKPGFFMDSIIKIDVKTQTSKVWTPATNHLPSEPVFVAHPNATAEDDGVLLTIALDAERELSSLIVINATNMKELGRAQLPVVVGYGFHGLWGQSSGGI